MDFSAIHAGRGKPKRGCEPIPEWISRASHPCLLDSRWGRRPNQHLGRRGLWRWPYRQRVTGHLAPAISMSHFGHGLSHGLERFTHLAATGQTEFAMELRGRFKGYFTIKKSPIARASMPAQ